MKNIRFLPVTAQTAAVLLTFFALSLFCCTEESHNFGVDQDSLCSGVSTAVAVQCLDFYTDEPLSGQKFQVQKKEIIGGAWGGPLTECVDTLRTGADGKAFVRFTHDYRPNFEHTLLHISRNDWHSTATYGIPEGCDNSYTPRLKKAQPITLEVRNESGQDLGVLNFEVHTLPSHANLGGTYRPRFVVLENSLSLGPFPSGKSEKVDIKVLPEERTVVSYASLTGPFFTGRDTFYTAQIPQDYVLRILR